MITRIVAIAMIFVAGTFAATAQHTDNRRSVSVEGEAETFLIPDRASISIGVETEGKVAAQVKKDNDAKVRAILAALKKAGIEEKDVQTSNLSLEPVYNWRPEGQREFVKYTMRNTVYVLVRDLSKLDAVVGTSVEVGSNMLNNIDFSVSNAKAVRDSLRLAAAKDARTKAEALAGAVGARVGKPISINENSNYQPPVPVYRAQGLMKMADAESGPTVSAGQVQIRVTVSATFELE